MLMGRRLRTRLPDGARALCHFTVDIVAVCDHRETNTQVARKGIEIKVLGNCQRCQPEDWVRLRNNKYWIKAKAGKSIQDKRSYWVRTENGGLFPPNRQHLMKIPKSDNCKYMYTDRYSDLDDQNRNSIPNQKSRPPPLTAGPARSGEDSQW